MVSIAQTRSKDFSVIRVDLHLTLGRICVGELTPGAAVVFVPNALPVDPEHLARLDTVNIELTVARPAPLFRVEPRVETAPARRHASLAVADRLWRVMYHVPSTAHDVTATRTWAASVHGSETLSQI